MPKIAIIGSGVAGLWAGLLLSQHYNDIHIYECQSQDLKKSCSYRAGGMLAPYCESESAEDAVTSLGVASLALWKHYFPDHTILNGSLLLAHPKDMNRLNHFTAVTDHHQTLSNTEIAQLEPDLEGMFSKGLFYPDEGHVNPREILPLLIARNQAQGVTFHFNHDRISDIDADMIIDSRGLSAKDSLSLRGVKGEMILIRSQEITLQRPVRLLHPHHPLYIVPRPDHIYMIGATTIEASSEKDFLSVRSAGELLTQAYYIHPAFAEAEILEMNAASRPALIDNIPKVIHQDGRYYINGLYRHGWMVAPALAQQLTEIIAC